MRKILIYLFSICLVVNSQDRKAFLLGINEFETTTGWSTINGADDIRNIVKPTLERSGFKSKNIHSFTIDSLNTYENTLFQLKSFSKTINQNDQVFIYFSTHGQRVWDQNNDEDDQIDEALVLYNTPMCKESSFYKGNKHFVDDSLKIILDTIRKRSGVKGNVFLGIDACFSADIDKAIFDEAKIRGISTVCNKSTNEFESKKSNIGKSLIYNSKEGYAPLTVIASSQSNQVSRQTPDNKGALTHFLFEILSQNYKEEIKMITLKNDIIHLSQNHKYLTIGFNDGKFEYQTPDIQMTQSENRYTFFYSKNQIKNEVKTYYLQDYFTDYKDSIKIFQHGEIQGICKGCIFKIVDIKNQHLGFAKVTESNHFQSKIIFDNPNSLNNSVLSNAYFIPYNLAIFKGLGYYVKSKKQLDIVLENIKNEENKQYFSNQKRAYQIQISNDNTCTLLNDNDIIFSDIPLSKLESYIAFHSYIQFLEKLRSQQSQNTNSLEILDENNLIAINHSDKHPVYFAMINISSKPNTFEIVFPSNPNDKNYLLPIENSLTNEINMNILPNNNLNVLAFYTEKPFGLDFWNSMIFNHFQDILKNQQNETVTIDFHLPKATIKFNENSTEVICKKWNE